MNITGVEIINVLAIIGVSHLLLAALSMVELKLIPFYTRSEKKLWFIKIWMMPLIGSLLFHQKAKSGWRNI